MKYAASIDIKADTQKVWKLLTNVDAQNRWNSTLIELKGKFEPGAKLSFLTKVSPKRAFGAKVKSLTNNHMVLTGGMPLGLFKGERVFKVTDLGEGTTRFETEEEFSGPLLGLISKSMPDLQPSFDTLASDLKKAAEA